MDNDPNEVRHILAESLSLLADLGWSNDKKVHTGIGLEEALNNGMYHGNLALPSHLRENRLLYRAMFDERRSIIKPYCDRVLRCNFRLMSDYALFVIRDQGSGFDTAELPDCTDPTNLEKPSGRGLLLMRTFFDRVVYNPRGNRVWLKNYNPAG